MIKHIWFDLYGTIAIPSGSFQAAHDNYRYQVYAQISGKPLDKAREDYDRLYLTLGSNSAVFASLGLAQDFWQYKFEEFRRGLPVYEERREITETLSELSGKVPISLFTNMRLQEILKTLSEVRIPKEIFANILSADEVAERKPHPGGFLRMLELSKLPPEQLLYVGDRVSVDILPAKKVGMKACLVFGSSPEADYSFLNFKDILSVLK